MNTAEKNLQILAGGVDITVKMRDGREQPIKVKAVPFLKLKEYGMAMGDEDKELKIYTGKADDFLESITDEGLVEILDKGREINALPLGKWALRQRKALELLNPAIPSDSSKPSNS